MASPCVVGLERSPPTLMLVGISRLIRQPFNLEHHSRDKGRDDEEGHNGGERPVLYSWVQPDQWDQKKSRDAKRNGGKNVNRVGRFRRRGCLMSPAR